MFLGVQALDETNNNAQSQSANRVVRTIAGASGLGLVGSIAAQFSSEAATGIGFYGAAWSVFNHVVARGHNILLVQDTPVQIRFGAARTSSSHRCARQEIHLLRTPSSAEKRLSEGPRSGEFPNRRDRGKEEAFVEQ